MKILRVKELVNDGKLYSSPEFDRIKKDIQQAILAIEYPKGSGGFYLHDKSKSNGVKPIKEAFIEKLNDLGWEDERKVTNKAIRRARIDSALLLSNGKYFGVEWETGNISSSHRAINRLLKGMMEGYLAGGFLVLPSRSMYNYLTDRIGNFQELEPYFAVMADSSAPGILGVIEIEHDGVSPDIPPIKKGTDGRALI